MKRAIIGHQLQKWEDMTDVETYLRTFEEAIVESEYEERKWPSILQKYLAGKALKTYKEVATVGEATYKATKRKGGLHLKPPKFEHIFVAAIPFPPFFWADTFDTSLLLIVCALR